VANLWISLSIIFQLVSLLFKSMIEKLEKLIFGPKISKTKATKNIHRKVGGLKRTFSSQFVIAHLVSLPFTFWPFFLNFSIL